jgi:hypothetical protein
MTISEINKVYQDQFGEVDRAVGFRLATTVSQKGNFVVRKFYQRNSWVDETEEHEAVYDQSGKLISEKRF